MLEDVTERARFSNEYQKTAALYYDGQPALLDILTRIEQFIDRM